jgi:hypothetical protein
MVTTVIGIVTTQYTQNISETRQAASVSAVAGWKLKKLMLKMAFASDQHSLTIENKNA